MRHYESSVVVKKPNGDLQAGPLAKITVYKAGTTDLATIYFDNGIMVKPNPFYADTLGNYDFYAADGYYDIELSSPMFVTRKILNEEFFDSDEKIDYLFPNVDAPVTQTDEEINQIRYLIRTIC